MVSHLVAQGIDLKPSAGEGSDNGRKWIAEGKIEVEFVHVEGKETFLLENRKSAVALYRSGVLVSIPDPARYALHCLLASDQGCWSQAEWLIGVISDECPFDLYKAYKELKLGWPDSIQKLEATLTFMPESSMILDEILDIFE